MNKGSTKLLIIVGLAALLICSWYMLIDNTSKENEQYNQQIEEARTKLSMGLYQVALEKFEDAKDLRDSIELRNEMAQVYQDYASGSKYEAFCQQIVSDYPEDNLGYERLAKYYNEQGAYSLFFGLKKSAEKRGIKSTVIDELAKPLEYAYQLETVNVEQIAGFYGNYGMALRSNGFWGFLSTKGKTAISFNYVKIAPFLNSVFFAETQSGEFGLFDAKGKMISRVTDGRKIEDCTALTSGKMAVKYNGKYHYCDKNFTELFGEYDDASVFVGGVAAVMNDGKWAIINEKGEKVTDYIFEEIKLDEIDIAFRNGVGFAKQNGKYILIDKTGKQVGSGAWEEVDPFNSDMIAAVKSGGKWGFIDASGKEVVACQYEGAKSFCNGLAAVQIDGKWGYISSTDYELKFEAKFAEALDFTNKGTAFVKEKETSKWKMIQIYRLA